MASTEIAIAGMRIGIPVIVGGVVGGAGLYYAVDAACSSFRERPWLSGLVGALAGMGAGFFVSQMLK